MLQAADGGWNIRPQKQDRLEDIYWITVRSWQRRAAEEVTGGSARGMTMKKITGEDEESRFGSLTITPETHVWARGRRVPHLVDRIIWQREQRRAGLLTCSWLARPSAGACARLQQNLQNSQKSLCLNPEKCVIKKSFPSKFFKMLHYCLVSTVFIFHSIIYLMLFVCFRLFLCFTNSCVLIWKFLCFL